MKAEEMWKAFGAEGDYEALSFGEEGNHLARLVRDGIKTATCAPKIWYEVVGKPLPEVGQYSVILDADDNAVCVIRFSKVYTTPFNEVTQEHALKEAEGDLSSWREEHRLFLTEGLSAMNLSFSEDMPMLCQEFECVYP